MAAVVVVVATAPSGCGETDAAGPADHGGKTSTAPTHSRAVRIGADDLADHVGDAVLIGGTAVTAASGAAVTFADGTPVYVNGLAAWADALEGRGVDVRGVLRRRPAQAPSGREPSQGLTGETFALDDARWTWRGRRR